MFEVYGNTGISELISFNSGGTEMIENSVISLYSILERRELISWWSVFLWSVLLNSIIVWDLSNIWKMFEIFIKLDVERLKLYLNWIPKPTFFFFLTLYLLFLKCFSFFEESLLEKYLCWPLQGCIHSLPSFSLLWNI